MTTTEEILGLIKGLGEAVKDQLKAHTQRISSGVATTHCCRWKSRRKVRPTHTQNLCHKTRPP